MSSKNSNKLNVPEARAAMDKFKMEAASDLDVPDPYYDHSILIYQITYFLCNTSFILQTEMELRMSSSISVY